MKAVTTAPIAAGSRVQFDSDEGPQAGVVAAIKTDLGNGQLVALVNVADTLDNLPWQVPVAELQRAGAAA